MPKQLSDSSVFEPGAKGGLLDAPLWPLLPQIIISDFNDEDEHEQDFDDESGDVFFDVKHDDDDDDDDHDHQADEFHDPQLSFSSFSDSSFDHQELPALKNSLGSWVSTLFSDGASYLGKMIGEYVADALSEQGAVAGPGTFVPLSSSYDGIQEQLSADSLKAEAALESSSSLPEAIVVQSNQAITRPPRDFSDLTARLETLMLPPNYVGEIPDYGVCWRGFFGSLFLFLAQRQGESVYFKADSLLLPDAQRLFFEAFLQEQEGHQLEGALGNLLEAYNALLFCDKLSLLDCFVVPEGLSDVVSLEEATRTEQAQRFVESLQRCLLEEDVLNYCMSAFFECHPEGRILNCLYEMQQVLSDAKLQLPSSEEGPQRPATSIFQTEAYLLRDLSSRFLGAARTYFQLSFSERNADSSAFETLQARIKTSVQDCDAFFRNKRYKLLDWWINFQTRLLKALDGFIATFQKPQTRTRKDIVRELSELGVHAARKQALQKVVYSAELSVDLNSETRKSAAPAA